MYKCIIFDIDGTIIKSEQVISLALKRYFKEYEDRELSNEEAAGTVGLSTKYIFEHYGIIEKMAEGSKIINKLISEMSCLIHIYDGMEDTIKDLYKAEIFLGLVSSKTIDEFEQDFPRFGLDKYFSKKVLASDTAKHKPYPDPLLKFVENTGFDLKDVLYIGDAVYDYKAAASAGIDFGLACWGCTDDSQIRKPKYRLEHPKDILGLVL